LEPILVLDKVDKAFGGLHVTDNVSFTVNRGELSAIIGPNGAGKTTLFNLITGYLRPESGTIRFKGEDIVGLRTQKIVARGIGRSFQITSVFPEETVLNNIRISSLSRLKQTTNFVRPAHRFRRATDAAHHILDSLGLTGQAERPAFELAHGDQKLLDIGVALALEPELILMDEPTAGMSPEERVLTRELIRKLWKEYNLTMVFIEHDMDMVFGIAQVVRVLQQGALLVEGTPDEIRNNKEVITAYLGEEL